MQKNASSSTCWMQCKQPSLWKSLQLTASCRSQLGWLRKWPTWQELLKCGYSFLSFQKGDNEWLVDWAIATELINVSIYRVGKFSYSKMAESVQTGNVCKLHTKLWEFDDRDREAKQWPTSTWRLHFNVGKLEAQLCSFLEVCWHSKSEVRIQGQLKRTSW